MGRIPADLQWAYDVLNASTWDELIAVYTRHGIHEFVGGLERQRAIAEEAGIDLVEFEKQKLDGTREWVLRFFVDPRHLSDEPESDRTSH